MRKWCDIVDFGRPPSNAAQQFPDYFQPYRVAQSIKQSLENNVLKGGMGIDSHAKKKIERKNKAVHAILQEK